MMKKYFVQSSFFKNVVALMTGTTIAQAIPILVSPVLSRIYSPEDFGLYSVFLSISSVFAVISTARYEAAVMLPSKDTDSLSIVVISIAIAFSFGFVVFCTILFFNKELTDIIGNEMISMWLYLVPIVVILQGIYQTLRQWNNRKQNYKLIASYSVVQSGTIASTNVSLGYSTINTNGLIIGSVFGQLISTTMYVRKFFDDFRSFNNKITINNIKRNALRYKSFVQYGTPALLTSSIARESLSFLVTQFLGSAVLGYVYFINRLLSIPSTLIGTALGDVFYQHVSTANKEKVFKKICQFTMLLSILSIVMFSIGLILCENYFLIVFGQEWANSIVYIKYLMFVSFFSFIFAPLTVLFNYFEIQHFNFIWQLSWLVSNIVVFMGCHHYEISSIDTIKFFSIKQAMLYLVGIISFLYIAYRRNK